MAAGNTYTPIATYTIPSNTTTYTFSSIPGTYTDLVLIASGIGTSAGDFGVCLRYNGDTGSNYSVTQLDGNGSSPASYREINAVHQNIGILSGAGQGNSIFNIFNYSNTTTYKTTLARGNAATNYLRAAVGTWRNTAAITSVTIYNPTTSMVTGTTLTLYGITAA